VSSLPDSLTAWLDASAIDLDTRSDGASAILPKLAEAGLFRVGIPVEFGGSGGATADAVEAIAAVSEHSLAAGFVFWSQRTFIEYLLQSFNDELRERLLPQLLSGDRAGATGLSNAMKFLSGIEELQVKASQSGASFQIDGKLPWVTNLQPSGFDVAVAVQGDGDVPAFVASLSSDGEGVQRSADLDLLGLRASSTAAITIDSVQVTADRILDHDAKTWLPKVRPAFLGLQCGLSIGLARRAIAETERQLSSGRDILAGPVKSLAKDLVRTQALLFKGLSDRSFESRSAPLFRLRIRLAELAAEAVQLELSATGGKAYLAQPGRDFQRRLREVAFIPVITPSLVQLKTALRAQEEFSAVSGVA
jgi:alkylation response protein AidB-like acyl-CoA dehydrogenase